MAANIGSGSGANVHFDEALVASTPPQKEPQKKEAGKSILKPTAPVAAPTEEQVRRERIKAEFLRGALGAAPPNTKQALDALFAMAKKRPPRLQPDVTAGSSGTQAKEEENAEHGEENKKG